MFYIALIHYKGLYEIFDILFIAPKLYNLANNSFYSCGI